MVTEITRMMVQWLKARELICESEIGTRPFGPGLQNRHT